MTAVGREAASVSYARLEVVALRCGERHSVRGGDADRRGAAHCQRPDRVGELASVVTAELDHLVGQQPLVENDNGVVLEPDDALRIEIARRRGVTPQVP